jgi:hypothetical protein
MAAPEQTVDAPGIVHLHETTVLNGEAGLGLAMTVVPRDAFSGSRPRTVQDVAELLGLKVLREYEPTDRALLAVLTGLLAEDGANESIDRIDRLVYGGSELRELNLNPAIGSFVEHCAYAPILAVEESLLKPKVLAAMLGGAAAICVAAIGGGAGLVVAAVVGVGVVLTVAVVGPPAVALGERLAAGIAP